MVALENNTSLLDTSSITSYRLVPPRPDSRFEYVEPMEKDYLFGLIKLKSERGFYVYNKQMTIKSGPHTLKTISKLYGVNPDLVNDGIVYKKPKVIYYHDDSIIKVIKFENVEEFNSYITKKADFLSTIERLK